MWSEVTLREHMTSTCLLSPTWHPLEFSAPFVIRWSISAVGVLRPPSCSAPLNRQLICVAALNTHSAVHKTFHKQAHRYKVPTNLPRWLGGGNKLFGCGPLPLVSVFHDSVEPAKMFSSQYQAQVVAGRLCKDTSWLNVSPLLYIVMLLI